MNFQQIINSKQPVLVDFFADWCGPCHMIAPTIKQFGKELEGKVKVLKVDVDKNQKAAMKYRIQSIPTLIIFKEGKIVWRHSGVVDLAKLKSAIKPHL